MKEVRTTNIRHTKYYLYYNMHFAIQYPFIFKLILNLESKLNYETKRYHFSNLYGPITKNLISLIMNRTQWVEQIQIVSSFSLNNYNTAFFKYTLVILICLNVPLSSNYQIQKFLQNKLWKIESLNLVRSVFYNRVKHLRNTS